MPLFCLAFQLYPTLTLTVPDTSTLSISFSLPKELGLEKHLYKSVLEDYKNPNLRACVGRTENPWMTFMLSEGDSRKTGAWASDLEEDCPEIA